MKILEFFKNLFQSKGSNETSIINISDSFILPSRKMIKNNANAVELLNEYKEEYKSILSSKKYLTSEDLNIDYLYEYISMNDKLITDMLLKYDSIDVFSNIENDFRKQFELEVYIRKLKKYMNELLSLDMECQLRLIALKEIYRMNKLFLSKNKRERIENNINTLTITLQTFFYKIKAISLEANAYINHSNIVKDLNDISNFIHDKGSELEKLLIIIEYYNLFDVSDIKIGSSLEEKLDFIANFEIELEKYSYTHKGVLSRSNELLDYIKFCSYNEEISDEDLDKLLISLQKLELRFLIYYNYGKNLITKEEIEKLYEIKFNLSLKRNHDFNTYPFAKIWENKIEKETYEKIIMNKINNILKDKDKKIRNYFGKDYREAIKLMSEVLKNGKEKYDADIILKYPMLLYFIVSLDNPYKLDEFYDNYLVNIYDYQSEIQLYVKTLYYNHYVPLSTIYRIAKTGEYVHTIYNKPWSSVHHSPLYKLYNLYISKKEILPPNHLNYYFPEGIREINTENLPVGETVYNVEPLMDTIQKNSRNKTVFFPRSMRKVTGNVFGTDVNYFCLNEGLEELGESSLIASKQDELIIPSTLAKIDPYAMKFSYIKRINFNNFKESKLLQDDEELKQFLSNFFYLDKKELENKIAPEIINATHTNKVAFDMWWSTNKVTVKTRLNYLTLYDNGEVYSIDLNKLSFKTTFNYNEYIENNLDKGMLSNDALTKLVRLLKEEIERVTGYHFNEDENILKKTIKVR